ncbi:MAG: C40 family peptidase, partial [Bacilli bacterium]|nr:C40 family peptidase [Bacilli bacterium]
MDGIEIGVSDYKVFDDGASKAKTLEEKLKNFQEKIQKVKTTLESESTFMGPICDNCKSAIDKSNSNVESNITSAKELSNYLISVSTCYKNSDFENLKKLLLIKDSDTTSTGIGKSSDSSIQSALDWAIGIANDNSYGYSQSTRWGNPNYDCSSLVISAYEQAGIPVKTAGARSTRDMKEAFLKCGFEWIPGDPKKTGLTLQPGDVLLKVGSHTEMYVGDGKNVGAHSNYDKRDGDRSGN